MDLVCVPQQSARSLCPLSRLSHSSASSVTVAASRPMSQPASSCGKLSLYNLSAYISPPYACPVLPSQSRVTPTPLVPSPGAFGGAAVTSDAGFHCFLQSIAERCVWIHATASSHMQPRYQLAPARPIGLMQVVILSRFTCHTLFPQQPNGAYHSSSAHCAENPTSAPPQVALVPSQQRTQSHFFHL